MHSKIIVNDFKIRLINLLRNNLNKFIIFVYCKLYSDHKAKSIHIKETAAKFDESEKRNSKNF